MMDGGRAEGPERGVKRRIESGHLYTGSTLSLKISNALHALCHYVANRKHLIQRLKESKCSLALTAKSVFRLEKCFEKPSNFSSISTRFRDIGDGKMGLIRWHQTSHESREPSLAKMS